MKYRNTKTGIEMNFASPISGENWEPVETPAQAPEAEKPKPKKKAVKKDGGKK